MIMNAMMLLNTFIARLQRDEEGQGLAEYALIIVLVAIAVVTALTALGTQITGTFDGIVSELGGS